MRNPSSGSKTTPCCSKVGIKKGPWTPEEDELLSNYINREGEGRWRTLPKRAGLLRCGKSCRLRWMNYLRPSVKRGRIAPDEEDLILRLHRLLGNRWSLIAGRIPGRTDNEIKNYWNTHLSKKLISQGIDPRTHKPLDPTLTSSQSAGPDQHQQHDLSNPKPNPNPVGKEEEEAGRSNHETAANGNGNFTTNLQGHYQNHHQQLVDNNHILNWQNGDDGDCFMSGFLPSNNSHGLGCNQEENNNYMNGNIEDTFSSFLDSLINDNVFANHQQLQQPPPPPGGMVVTASSSGRSFSHGGILEAPDMVSTMAHALGDAHHQQSTALDNNQRA